MESQHFKVIASGETISNREFEDVANLITKLNHMVEIDASISGYAYKAPDKQIDRFVFAITESMPSNEEVHRIERCREECFGLICTRVFAKKQYGNILCLKADFITASLLLGQQPTEFDHFDSVALEILVNAYTKAGFSESSKNVLLAELDRLFAAQYRHFDEAERCEKLLDALRTSANPSSRADRLAIAIAQCNMGMWRQLTEEYEAAQILLSQSYEAFCNAGDEFSNTLLGQLSTIRSSCMLAATCGEAGKSAEARSYCQKTAEHLVQALQFDSVQISPTVAQCYTNIGEVYEAIGDLNKAKKAYELAIKVCDECPSFNEDFKECERQRAKEKAFDLYARRTKLRFERACFFGNDLILTPLAKASPETFLEKMVANRVNRTTALEQVSMVEKAEKIYKATVAFTMPLLDGQQEWSLLAHANICEDYADLLFNQGRDEEAAAFSREAMDALSKRANLNKVSYLADFAGFVERLACRKAAKQEYEQAEMLFRKVTGLREWLYSHKGASAAEDLANCYELLAYTLTLMDAEADAESYRRKAEAVRC